MTKKSTGTQVVIRTTGQTIDEARVPAPAKWSRVVELLGRLYERYSEGKAGPAHSGYDTALGELMRAYDEWLG